MDIFRDVLAWLGLTSDAVEGFALDTFLPSKVCLSASCRNCGLSIHIKRLAKLALDGHKSGLLNYTLKPISKTVFCSMKNRLNIKYTPLKYKQFHLYNTSVKKTTIEYGFRNLTII